MPPAPQYSNTKRSVWHEHNASRLRSLYIASPQPEQAQRNTCIVTGPCQNPPSTVPRQYRDTLAAMALCRHGSHANIAPSQYERSTATARYHRLVQYQHCAIPVLMQRRPSAGLVLCCATHITLPAEFQQSRGNPIIISAQYQFGSRRTMPGSLQLPARLRQFGIKRAS